jgi:hypothetical protein
MSLEKHLNVMAEYVMRLLSSWQTALCGQYTEHVTFSKIDVTVSGRVGLQAQKTKLQAKRQFSFRIERD